MTDDTGVPKEIRDSAFYKRWREPPPEWLTPEREAKRRLADAMRDVIEQLDSTSAPLESLVEAAEDLERIATQFRDRPHETEYEGYRETANVGPDIHASFDRSPVIGYANPLAGPLRLRVEQGVVRGEVQMGSAYEGPPGCVHGGLVASLFDELLGATQSLSGKPGMTGRLTVHYRSPTPLHTPLELEGRIVDVSGRKITTSGQLTAEGRLCAEAEGLFISIDVTKFMELKDQRDERERHRRDGD